MCRTHDILNYMGTLELCTMNKCWYISESSGTNMGSFSTPPNTALLKLCMYYQTRSITTPDTHCVVLLAQALVYAITYVHTHNGTPTLEKETQWNML